MQVGTLFYTCSLNNSFSSSGGEGARRADEEVLNTFT